MIFFQGPSYPGISANAEGAVSFLEIYCQHEEEGPSCLASTCCFKLSCIHTRRRCFLGGTLVVRPDAKLWCTGSVPKASVSYQIGVQDLWHPVTGPSWCCRAVGRVKQKWERCSYLQSLIKPAGMKSREFTVGQGNSQEYERPHRFPVRCGGSRVAWTHISFCRTVQKLVWAEEIRHRRRGGPYQIGGWADMQWPAYSKDNNVWGLGKPTRPCQGDWTLLRRLASEWPELCFCCGLHNALLLEWATGHWDALVSGPQCATWCTKWPFRLQKCC